ncbi:MAG: flippase activity-associated protein Agl23 [Chloroflexota bacterium]
MAQQTISIRTRPDGDGGFLDRPLAAWLKFDWETIAWIVLMLVAVFTRFYDVGIRAMSHDESLHTLYSYYLYDAGNYEHNPMMHGPLLFHLNALAYFLFGATDTTARIWPVIAGLATIWMARLFRPYIGRLGALMAGVLILVSPSLLFHSRYIRNDIYIAFFTMLWIYGAFRYLDTKSLRWVVVMVLGMAFGFITKENHFMGGAIMGAFFSGLALWQAVSTRTGNSITNLWQNPSAELAVTMLTMVLPFTAPVGHLVMEWDAMAYSTQEDLMRSAMLVGATTLLAIIIAFIWFGLRPKENTTPTKAVESEDEVVEDVQETQPQSTYTFGFWLRMMGLFWVIQILFFTTFLTNALNGMATGIVGSLGYWLAQQEVARGGQPWYYYFMLGGLYEFLPLILSLAGIVMVFAHVIRRRWDPVPQVDLPSELQSMDEANDIAEATEEDGSDDAKASEKGSGRRRRSKRTTRSNARGESSDEPITQTELWRHNRVYFAIFSIWWIIASWAAYTIAGEKMPWLMTHMALPMCVFGGWYLGSILNHINWSESIRKQGIWLIGISPAILFTLGILLTSFPSFGREVGELSGSLQWVLALIIGGGLVYIAAQRIQVIGWGSALRLMAIGVMTVLFLLTIRFSYMLTYINYDLVTEYLVYAHASPDIKRALNEIDLISERTVGERNIVVAYDDDSSWPLSWYMRSYPNSKFYGANPTSDSMSADVIIVGPKNYDKVRPYVARDYVKRTYRLVWWPDQGYFNLTWERFWSTLTDREKMENIWNIFFYRRYQDDNDPNRLRDLTKWPNRHDFEMYVKRDVAIDVWDLSIAPILTGGVGLQNEALDKEIDLNAVGVYQNQYQDLTLTQPRTIAVGPDGSRVLVDTGNNRIVQLDVNGNYVNSFGSLCKLGEGEASGCLDPDGSGPLALGDGQFFEPWGAAVAPDGHIYIADTWNGRIQVFDAAGNFVRKWGYFNTTNGELGDGFAMFGPRGIAVDINGNLLVADTGNKRILQFSPTGELIHQIGGGGVILGRFEEPTAIAVSPVDGSVFVADAWNRRIQKLSPTLEAVEEWIIPSWQSEDIYHKPYIAVAANGDVYATDPELFRVFVYSPTGEIKATFGNYGAEFNRFGLPNGIAADPLTGSVLVADANNNRVMVFAQLE